MVNVWVVEAFKNIGCKLLKLVHWEVESLHKLIILHLLDIRTNDLVMKGVANNIDTREVGNRRENCVRTVEQRDLTLVVGLL
jgi:hypothetical protein